MAVETPSGIGGPLPDAKFAILFFHESNVPFFRKPLQRN